MEKSDTARERERMRNRDTIRARRRTIELVNKNVKVQ